MTPIEHDPDIAQAILDPYGACSSIVAFEVYGMDGVLAELEHHDIIPETIIDGTATITGPAGNRIRITVHQP